MSVAPFNRDRARDRWRRPHAWRFVPGQMLWSEARPRRKCAGLEIRFNLSNEDAPRKPLSGDTGRFRHKDGLAAWRRIGQRIAHGDRPVQELGRFDNQNPATWQGKPDTDLFDK